MKCGLSLQMDKKAATRIALNNLLIFTVCRRIYGFKLEQGRFSLPSGRKSSGKRTARSLDRSSRKAVRSVPTLEGFKNSLDVGEDKVCVKLVS